MNTFKLTGRFPEYQRAFGDGELALHMDRYGGILEMSLLTSYKHEDGRVYQDTCAVPIISRVRGRAHGRPLYGPAIQFLSEEKDGQLLYHEPLDPEILPWGVNGKSLGMIIDNGQLRFQFKRNKKNPEKLIIPISKYHLFNGEFRSNKNQHCGNGNDLHAARAEFPFDRDKPFKNASGMLKWDAPVFDKKENLLFWPGKLEFPFQTETFYLGIKLSTSITLDENENLWIVQGKWGKKDVLYAAMGIYTTEQALRENLKNGGSDYSAIDRQKRNFISRIEKQTAVAEIKGIPAATELMKCSPAYLNSLVLRNDPAIRAAQFKYGVFYLWDSVSPIRDFLWQGQFQKAKDLYCNLIDYPYLELSGWVVSQMVLMLEEILSFDYDMAFFEKAMTFLKRALKSQIKLTSPETGLVVSYLNCGVDDPTELDLDGLYPAPCVNGWWYGALRVLENIGYRHNDPDLIAEVAPLIPKIEKSFIKGFYDKKEGFLYSGIKEDLTHGKTVAFQNTSTLGIDYPFGTYLMRSILKPLAAYHAKKLYHPEGTAAVAWNTMITCEMWKSVHMNQHLGHESKLARLAGNMKNAYRMVTGYLNIFDHYKCAIETFNYSGCLGNEGQVCDWQTFSSTSACEAIRTGLAGIGRHGGGLYYIPAEDDHVITLDQINLKSSSVAIEISGKGKYCTMTLNGKAVKGSMQLPVDLLKRGKNIWKIKRSNTPFTGPVLLTTYGAPIHALETNGKELSFRIGYAGHYPMEFAASAKAKVYVDGKPVKTEINSDNGHLYIDTVFAKDSVILIKE